MVAPCMYPEGCYPEPADCEYLAIGALTRCEAVRIEVRVDFLTGGRNVTEAERREIRAEARGATLALRLERGEDFFEAMHEVFVSESLVISFMTSETGQAMKRAYAARGHE